MNSSFTDKHIRKRTHISIGGAPHKVAQQNKLRISATIPQPFCAPACDLHPSGPALEAMSQFYAVILPGCNISGIRTRQMFTPRFTAPRASEDGMVPLVGCSAFKLQIWVTIHRICRFSFSFIFVIRGLGCPFRKPFDTGTLRLWVLPEPDTPKSHPKFHLIAANVYAVTFGLTQFLPRLWLPGPSQYNKASFFPRRAIWDEFLDEFGYG
ncbi:hypothetical protein EDB86DRAFT_3218420 [Lactarius hatsudake]|nr:hypothetical protein EDB86DRAFT_3218420 [Lactarius hatsudake]